MRPEGDLPGPEPIDEAEDILCSCWLGEASRCSSQQSSCLADRQRRTKARRQERACRLTAVVRGLSSECAFCLLPTVFASSWLRKSNAGACSGEAKWDAICAWPVTA